MDIKMLEMIFVFAGGLGMFIYGMNVMSSGLQKTAGGKMKRLLGYLTRNRFLGVLVGTLVTFILQSSSATTVIVVGFVNAGIINLTQAVGIIMGANIGTTITAWMVSMSEWSKVLKPDFFAPLVVAIGAFIMMFNSKNEKRKELGEILFGFGLLFIGLTLMSDAIKPYRDAPIFTQAFSVLGKNPFLGVIVGAVVTAIIQSSSASVSILQTLAMNLSLGWNSVVYITLGQNIGTTITAILASIGANKTAKRAAAIHLMFNLIGTVIFGTVVFIIFKVNTAFANSQINSVEIAIFHTLFNVANTLLLFPFANLLVKISGKIIDDSKIDTTDDDIRVTLRHLDERIFESPSFAVQNAVKEVVHMGEITLDNAREAVEALLKNNEEKARKVLDVEKIIDAHQKIISEYLVKINNLSITEKQSQIVNNLFHTISNIERVGDHAENLADLALEKIENNIYFSDDAYEELKEICEIAIDSFDNAIKARDTENIEFIKNVEKMEQQVDDLKDKLRQQHIDRLSQGVCTSENGVIFIDALINLERISDHSLNIANFVENELE
ncbi:Na/Pi cotransporter family protein [Mobilitalea sibirica]|uniref:Na/Pi cotransporter family protein n=1 Tax=Mobilitalea sibirica TaxID=1462919 RepID=A0A8J7H1S3_9FIRM|nr:Na/Pi cotransporter family protein [Mobilitalea sibirica]MBH1940245.1 Na/Pi cotransporter family protein [Mobilitalea sibirica]